MKRPPHAAAGTGEPVPVGDRRHPGAVGDHRDPRHHQYAAHVGVGAETDHPDLAGVRRQPGADLAAVRARGGRAQPDRLGHRLPRAQRRQVGRRDHLDPRPGLLRPAGRRPRRRHRHLECLSAGGQGP